MIELISDALGIGEMVAVDLDDHRPPLRDLRLDMPDQRATGCAP